MGQTEENLNLWLWTLLKLLKRRRRRVSGLIFSTCQYIVTKQRGNCTRESGSDRWGAKEGWRFYSAQTMNWKFRVTQMLEHGQVCRNWKSRHWSNTTKWVFLLEKWDDKATGWWVNEISWVPKITLLSNYVLFWLQLICNCNLFLI